MPTKKKEIKKKPIAKKVVKKPVKKLSVKWSGAEHQIPKAGDYFVTKGVEGRVVKINTPTAGINDVSINGAIFIITNGDLRVQINKTKGYFQKKIVITKGEYVVGTKLTVKQKLFCNHYIKNDELRGNATLCYNLAFDFKLYEKDKTRVLDEDQKEIPGTSEYDRGYNNCSAYGSALIRSLKIQEENRKLWNELLNDTIVDSRLSKIITKGDDKDSLGGIKEYNKMNGRVIDITKNESLSDEAKAGVYKKLAEKVNEMKPEEINTALNDLLN